MHPIVRGLRTPLKTIQLSLQRPAVDCAWRVGREELEGVEILWPRLAGWRHRHISGWVDPLFHGFRSRVPVNVISIPQDLEGCVVILFRRKHRVYRVGINTSDYPDLSHFGSPAAALDLEFKMQYRCAGYGDSRVVPGGYVSGSMGIDWFARGPRRERDRQRFRWDVYGRFGRQFATEVRTKAVQLLEGQTRVRFYGGLRKVSFPQFLREIAQSRVCIDLPGNGPFCFRFVNYLAVGACVISPPHETSMPVPLIDRHHVVYTRPDMSDLVDLCEQYANDGPAREAMMEASREYYRRHLYWRSLSTYYLRTMLDRLPE